MKSVDLGVLPNSICFSFIPPETARQMLFYPTWCGHYYCTSRYYMRRDSYPPLLVIYIRRGTLHVEYRGEQRLARAGDVVLLDCTEPHYYGADDHLEFLYMHYDGSNSHEITQHIIHEHGWLMRGEEKGAEKIRTGDDLQDSRNEQVNLLLQDMVYLYEHNRAETMFESSMRIYRLFSILLAPAARYSRERSPVTTAVEYIRAHVGSPITVEELASMASLSPYYFSHMFKRETGFSPMDYVINTRIEHAKSLLLTTNRSIAEIADEVGYASSGSLINLFVKKVGESPKQFRNHHRGLRLE